MPTLTPDRCMRFSAENEKLSNVTSTGKNIISAPRTISTTRRLTVCCSSRREPPPEKNTHTHDARASEYFE